jgi:Aspartyl protease
MRSVLRLWCAAIMTLLGAAAANAACSVRLQATVPVELADSNLLVTVAVNGQDATFILDTGADRTLMSEQAVNALGVERSGWVSSAIVGIAGGTQRPDAVPRTLTLGGVALRRHTLLGDTGVTVGTLPMSKIGSRSVVGMLGRDFLASFDLDLDMPERHLSLYEVHDCTSAFLPWTRPYAAIPAVMPVGTALVIAIALDQRPLRALIDTGASASLLTASGIVRMGISPEAMARDPGGNGHGVGPEAVPMRLHRFGSMQVGPEVIRDPSVWAATVHVVPIVDMLLGEDWLRSRHVWLSFTTKQVFVAGR